MGMHDYLICKAPLPGNPPEFVRAPAFKFISREANNLSTYELTADGRLVMTEGSLHGQGKPEQPPADYHGDLHFWAAKSDPWESIAYRARFTEGRLVSIIETDREDEAEHQARRLRFQEQQAKTAALLKSIRPTEDA